MPTGGYSPGPEQYGGSPGGAPLLKRVFESLTHAPGSAYTSDLTTPVGIERMAYARALTYDGYGANQRLANNFLPSKMTLIGLLARWEAVLGINPSPTDTETVRRNRVAAKFLAIGNDGTPQPIIDALTLALGPVFVGIVNTTVSQALVSASAVATIGARTAVEPLNFASTSPIQGMNPNAPVVSWSSTIAHVLVQTKVPATYSITQYLSAVASIGPIMDLMLPAWADWAWFLQDSASAIGWLLDDAHNLDFEVLAS